MYNKIFTKILDSSIWLETNPTRIVWLTFLASMDETGYAHFAAVGNLANRARVTLAEAEAAVKVLEAPDRESSDPANDGRRIERIPGGWMVLNAEKYRVLVTRAVIQEQTRLRTERWRNKKRKEAPKGTVTHGDASKRNGDAGVTPSVSVSVSGALAEDLAPAKPPRARNELSDALARACGSDPLQMTARQARSCAISANEIKKASPSVDESELIRRATEYRRKYRDAALTPSALCGHWSEFANGVLDFGKPSLADRAATQARLAKAFEPNPNAP